MSDSVAPIQITSLKSAERGRVAILAPVHILTPLETWLSRQTLQENGSRISRPTARWTYCRESKIRQSGLLTGSLNIARAEIAWISLASSLRNSTECWSEATTSMSTVKT